MNEICLSGGVEWGYHGEKISWSLMGYVAVYNNYGIWVCPGRGTSQIDPKDNHDDSDCGTQLGHRELEAIKPQNKKHLGKFANGSAQKLSARKVSQDLPSGKLT